MSAENAPAVTAAAAPIRRKNLKFAPNMTLDLVSDTSEGTIKRYKFQLKLSSPS
jgi:hypothetical protein